MNKQISTAVQSHRITMPGFLLLGALLLGASACTPGSSPVITSPVGGQATSVPQAGAQTTPPVSAAARDVNSMNACALFPGADVASALNTTLADPNNTGTGIGPSCDYGLLPSGASSGGTQVYILNLIPPKLYDLSLTALVNPQPIAGLGDKASMGTRMGTTTNDLMVLKTGDIGIEVLGDDATMVQKLAEYVITHLP